MRLSFFFLPKILPAQRLASCWSWIATCWSPTEMVPRRWALGVKWCWHFKWSVPLSYGATFTILASLCDLMCMMFEPLAEGNLLSHYMVDNKVSWTLNLICNKFSHFVFPVSPRMFERHLIECSMYSACALHHQRLRRSGGASLPQQCVLYFNQVSFI